MFDVYCNVQLAQRLVEIWGGTWRRVGRSIIYKESDGAEYLCRYTCGSSISVRYGKIFSNEKLVGIIFGIRRKDRFFLGRRELGTYDHRTISYGEGEVVA